MSDAAIIANQLTVTRGTVCALDAVSFALAPGKITGLIGPSGSGKTTLMRAIIGAQRLTAGSLQVLGLPVGSKDLRHKIGYVTQAPAVYLDLTVRQNLQYFAAIIGCTKGDMRRALQQVDLMQQADQLTESLSGGQLARVSLAIALLGDARLLVLDEPTVGLDPLLRKHLWQLFKGLATEGRTLLVSSHVMDEAEQCPQLLLLRDGRVLRHSSKQQLLATTNTSTVEAAFLKLVEVSSNAS